MLWSLLKIILFIGLVALGAWTAGQLLETSGGVQIAVAGTEFTLGPLESIIALVVLIFLGWLILRIIGLIVAFLRWVIYGEDIAASRYFGRRRERKGYDALSDSMMALASGDGRAALSKAEKADRYLNRPQLTNLITAQAAEMAGDRRKAEEVYKRLLENDDTRFVGVRGILKQKLAQGDTSTALKLAEKAFALRPKHTEMQDTLLQLQAEKADWKGARKTLNAKLKYGDLPRDVHKRRDAVLALSEAKDVFAEGSTVEAREAAIDANRMSPDLIPAAVLAARAYIANDKKKNATRVLKKAWEAQPHPDLAAAFAEIEPTETPDQRVKRFSTLTNMHRTHPETKMLASELHIAAEDFPAARKALGDLPESDPTARSLTMMAAIERGEGADDAIVKGWLARALTSPPGPQWVCEACQTAHPDWHPVCENCKRFDTLSWTRRQIETTQMASGAEMLPLIVGALENKATNADPDAEIYDAEVSAPGEVETVSPEPEEPVTEDTADDDTAADISDEPVVGRGRVDGMAAAEDDKEITRQT